MVVVVSGALVVRHIRPGDARYTDALAFIERIALRREGAAPPPPPDVLLVAFRGENIVGTMGLEFSDGTVRLPLEIVWDFTAARFPYPYDRSATAQYGRWMATEETVSAAVAYAACRFARSLGKTWGIFEAKPVIAEHLRQLGFHFHAVEDASLRVEKIPKAGRPYYTEGSPPTPFLFLLAHLEGVMAGHAPPVREERQEPRFQITFAQ